MMKRLFPLATLLLGIILGIAFYPASPNAASSDMEVKLLQVDVARLQEDCKNLEFKMQGVLDWVAAHDREAVQDDLPGVAKVQANDIEWLKWMVRGCLAGLALLLAETVGRHIVRFRNGR